MENIIGTTATATATATQASGIDATVRKQILAIRDSGLTNMFDARTVQYLAYAHSFYELVCFIEDDCAAYVNFILYGDGESCGDGKK